MIKSDEKNDLLQTISINDFFVTYNYFATLFIQYIGHAIVTARTFNIFLNGKVSAKIE